MSQTTAAMLAEVPKWRQRHTRPGLTRPSATSPLAPATIPRREPGPQDVQIEILFCGVCHSDLHQVRNEWEGTMPTVYPCVPGHEIVGRVTRVGQRGPEVQGGRPRGGRLHGRLLPHLRGVPATGRSSTASGPATFTYNAPDKHLGGVTYGGYSEQHRRGRGLRAARPGRARPGRRRAAAVRRHHDLLAAAALEGRRGPEGRRRGPRRARPHGREVRARLRRARRRCSRPRPARPRTRSGWARTRSWSRRTPREMPKHAGSFDFILDTVSAPHDLNAYLELLKRDGTLTLVGAPETPLPVGVVQPDLRAPAARRLAHRRHPRRPRRCWTSAPSTGSRPTSR